MIIKAETETCSLKNFHVGMVQPKALEIMLKQKIRSTNSSMMITLIKIVCYGIAYTPSKGDNSHTRKHSKIAEWNSDNPYMNLSTFLLICYL